MEPTSSMDKGKTPSCNNQSTSHSVLSNPYQGVTADAVLREEAEITAILQPTRDALAFRMATMGPLIDGDDVLFPLARLLHFTKSSAESQVQKPIFLTGDEILDEPGIQALEVREARCRAYLQVLCSIDEQMLKTNFMGSIEERQKVTRFVQRRRARLQFREQELAKDAALRTYHQLRAQWQSTGQHSGNAPLQHTDSMTPFTFNSPTPPGLESTWPDGTVVRHRVLHSGGIARTGNAASLRKRPVVDPHLETPTRSGKLTEQHAFNTSLLDAFNAQSKAAQRDNSSRRPSHFTSPGIYSEFNNAVSSVPEPLSPTAATPLGLLHSDTQADAGKQQAWSWSLDDIIDWDLIERDNAAAALEGAGTSSEEVQNQPLENVFTSVTGNRGVGNVEDGSTGSVWGGCEAGQLVVRSNTPVGHLSWADIHNTSQAGLPQQIAQPPMSDRRRTMLCEGEIESDGGDETRQGKQRAGRSREDNQPEAGYVGDPETEIRRLRAIIEGMGQNPDQP